MNNKKQFKNWWIDVLLLVGYLLSFYLELTGVILHQWLGVLVTILAGIHLVLHWDWVKVISARLFKGSSSRNRWYYLIDFLIMVGAVGIFESGLMISTWLNLPLLNYTSLLDLHIYVSIATLALTVIKIGLHWRWVVNTTLKVFAWLKPTAPQPALVPVRLQVPVEKRAIDRRQFIATMSLVSLGSLLAISNVFSKEDLALAEDLGTTVTATGDTVLSVAQQVLASPTATPITVSQPTAAAAMTAAATSTPQTVAQVNPTASSFNTACVVRCDRHCSYPGRCRRYTDQNGNGKCDLGECV